MKGSSGSFGPKLVDLVESVNGLDHPVHEGYDRKSGMDWPDYSWPRLRIVRGEIGHQQRTDC